jgi:GrpB-like predicted nucleotidyltransferase (UPF0157 family)
MELMMPSAYQGAAEDIFQSVRAEVRSIFPGARVEHIGSSAIPGALSKGDIDICVLVGERLMELGYVAKVDTLRTKQLCMLVAPRKDFDIALQVIEVASEFEFFILFRDMLRASPSLVEEYNSVKKAAAHLSDDAYREEKSRFIEMVLRN